MLEGLSIFLSQHKLENFTRTKMTGDASLKKFERLTASDRSLILCQIPYPAGETIQKIINISTFLQQLDLSAPIIYAADPYNGFLLLEDFGDDDFLVFLQKHKNSEVSLYKNAIDVLIKLQNQTIIAFPQLETYSKAILLEEVRKFTKYYIPCFKKLTNIENMLFEEVWDDLLGDISCELTTLVLRDYHSPNLFHLPQMPGLKKVGIIDLEDAMMGNMAYDVVSLLQDARYNLPSYHANALKDYYMQKSPIMSNPINTKAFNKAYYTLGLQRSLKVLGFVMYAKQQNHVKNYMHLIPLAKKYINLNLSKLDKASAVKHWLTKTGVLELI